MLELNEGRSQRQFNSRCEGSSFVALSCLAEHPHSKIDLSGIGGLSPLNCYSGRRTSLPLMWVRVSRGGLLSPTTANSLVSLSMGYLRNPEITIQSNCQFTWSEGGMVYPLEILLYISTYNLA